MKDDKNPADHPQYMVEGKKIYSKCCPGYHILGIVVALF